MEEKNNIYHKGWHNSEEVLPLLRYRLHGRQVKVHRCLSMTRKTLMGAFHGNLQQVTQTGIQETTH
jgi:hypothetical protein